MSNVHEDTDQTRPWQDLTLALGMDPAPRPWWLRAGIHFAYLAICLALTLLVKRELSL